MIAEFCNFTPAGISSVHQQLISHRKDPKFTSEGRRQGWRERDAEERGEGMGWREREKEGEGGTAAGSFFPVIIPGRCFSQPHLMKVKQYTSHDYVTTRIHLLS